MSFSKKYQYILHTALMVGAVMFFFSACSPAIGTPWYPRSVSASSNDLIVTGIQVKGLDVVPVLAETPLDDVDKIKKFSEAKTYTVNVPPEITDITAEDITITAVSSLSSMEAISVEVSVNGDNVPLSAGRIVPVTIKIADAAGEYAVQEKVLSITQSEPYDLRLISLKLFDKELVVDGTLQENTTVPYTVSSISTKDITATFSYGSYTPVIPVELGKPSVKLYENEEIELTLSVKELKGQYHAFSQTITVTREARPDNAAPALEPESIFILGSRYEDGKAVSVPVDTVQITANDVVAAFKDFGDLPVTVTPSPAVFGADDSLTLKLAVPAEEDKYEGWETSITVKKDPTALNNPQDKNGNKKYTVRVNTITEEQSPFDYYKQDYEFPAAKFDSWVLVMPSMSGIIPSYKFQDGSWSGSPESIDNIPSSIGSGVKAISNVKIYRYKTRAARWSAHGGYVPSADPNDSRFYFYRFTAEASGGVKPDSSLFCVDRYSKFLFYYSEPSNIEWIVGNAVPKDWVDYAMETKGDHLQFTEPFYMSDPVGYVKDDGSVVIYSWLKDNINGAKYHAQKNAAYTKPAGRSPGQAGYSPYRDKILTKRSEVETAINTAYTVAVPVILGQPKAVRIHPNAAEEAVFTVKTAPSPTGETLSYQWYKNATQSNEGGTPIAGATESRYAPDKSLEEDCYVYCVVTNKNTENGATETAHSRPVKLLIREGDLAADAEQPRIVKHPVGKIIPINTSGDTAKVTLTVEAVSVDKGELSYQWYKNTSTSTSSGTEITGETKSTYEFVADTSTVKSEYYYCRVTNTNNAVDGNKRASLCTEPAAVTVEEAYPVFFDTEGEGSITAIYEYKQNDKYKQKLIETGAYIKKGGIVRFLAKAQDGCEVQQWDGVTDIAANKLSASIVITKQETVKVVFRKIPDTRKLTITAKEIRNVNMQWDESYPYTYFVFNLKAQCGNEPVKSLWNANNGTALSQSLPQQTLKARKLYVGEQIMSGKYEAKTFDSKPNAYSIQFDVQLIKYHDTTGTYVGHEKYLSKYGESLVTISYNKGLDSWSLQPVADKDKDNVAIEFPRSFVLNRGEAKDFTIKYIGSDTGKKAVGTVEVTYTLKWE
jgi:hypothetical protein